MQAPTSKIIVREGKALQFFLLQRMAVGLKPFKYFSRLCKLNLMFLKRDKTVKVGNFFVVAEIGLLYRAKLRTKMLEVFIHSILFYTLKISDCFCKRISSWIHCKKSDLWAKLNILPFT